MTAAAEMHLSDETLAAYLDRALDQAVQASVMAHLESCDDCRSRVIEVNRTLALLKQHSDIEPSSSGPLNEGVKPADPEPPASDNPPDVVKLREKPKKRWRWAGAAVAAAVVIVFVLVGPMRTPDESGIAKLVKASESLEERDIDGRLMGDFPFKKRAVTFRTGETNKNKPIPLDEIPLHIALDEIVNARAPNPHERGVGLLLTGNRAEAVEALKEALAKGIGDRAVVENDLGVALMAGDENEKKDALTIFEGAWAVAKTPEAAWNRAYALQNLHQYEAAIAAWDDYLKLDPDSQWAQEAKTKQGDAQRDLELDRDPQLRRP